MLISKNSACIGFVFQLFFFISLTMSLFALPKEKNSEKDQSNMSSPQTIYIYAGPGASPEAVSHTEYTLKKLLPPHYVLRKITPEEVTQGAWVKNATLFIMPGGADLPYCQFLNGKGNERISTLR